MKRAKIFLLLFTLCCELTACGTKPADDVPPPDDETSAVDIEWFNTEFFNVGSGVCMTNMLLSSYYDTAADIDLYELFYNGPTGIQEEVTYVSQRKSIWPGWPRPVRTNPYGTGLSPPSGISSESWASAWKSAQGN